MQSGMALDFKIANLATDGQLLQIAREAANSVLDDDPELSTAYTQVYRDNLATNQAAFDAAKLLAKKEGISVGISSGAALSTAIELAKKDEYAGKLIVALLPDSGDRYYSTPLFQAD